MPSRPPLPPIDATPLKDIARSLRFAAERGGRTVSEALPRGALPDPAARLADAALATVRKIAKEADRGVSALAHAVLDRNDPPPSLAQPTETGFSAVAHDGLRFALAHLGAESSLISETAAQRAWDQVSHSGAGAKDSATAAALFLAMLNGHVLREAIWGEAARKIAPADTERVAVFAVLLAMLAEPANPLSLVPAATDLAFALRADLAETADLTSLAALFEEFRNNV